MINTIKNYLNGEDLFELDFSLKGLTHYYNGDDFYEIKMTIFDDKHLKEVTYVLRATKPVGFIS